MNVTKNDMGWIIDVDNEGWTDPSVLIGSRAVIWTFTLTDGTTRNVTHKPSNGDLYFYNTTLAQSNSNALSAMIGAGLDIDCDKPFKFVAVK